ncbi:hypothetical protein CDCA_CDCA05G1579 [Cyanidium caldarium]|uniref:Uncharacterized protein n=1 Tax=Cyanidium caldarium TaxID=2771 RepID=A0AAV9ITI2_CYACA|nr:hypothetical protein CDCA_CDCA05G1579 [Cyanidium caldarium]
MAFGLPWPPRSDPPGDGPRRPHRPHRLTRPRTRYSARRPWRWAITATAPSVPWTLSAFRTPSSPSTSASSAAPSADAAPVAYETDGQGHRRYYVYDPADRALQAHDVDPSPLHEWLNTAPERLQRQLRLVFLPEGFPHSVGPSYWNYSLWRGAQNVVSAMTAVLSTHALLSAVGLSSTSVAAATSWVLKDGIGQLGKLLTARRGRQFDADPKRYRLASDLLYDAGLSLEIVTPLFPQYFLALAAVGNFTKSVAITVGMACRNSVLSSFVLQGNLGDISAKNDAQNVVSNLTGMGLGIVTARSLPAQPRIRLAAFGALTAVYSFFNYKAMKAVKLCVLNRQRGALLADVFVRSRGREVWSARDANDRERIVPFLPEHFHRPPLRLGVALERVGALPPPRRRRTDRYVMALVDGEIRVALHEDATHDDLLRVLLQAAYVRRALGVRAGGAARCDDPRVHSALDLPRICFPRSLQQLDTRGIVEEARAHTDKHYAAFVKALRRRGWNTTTLQLAPERYRCRW